MHPVDWDNPAHPLARREPRRGRRAVLRARLRTPQGPLVVYCAHLEVFCGMLARLCHLADIFEDARRQVEQGFYHQAILGDLNTMAHGIARLSPNYCKDHMRFRSLGMDEAVVWERYVLSVPDPAYAPGQDCSWGPAVAGASTAGARQQRGSESAAEKAQGAPAAAAEAQQRGSADKAAAQQDAAAEAAMLAEELAEEAEVAADVAANGLPAPATAAVAAAEAAAAAAAEGTVAEAAVGDSSGGARGRAEPWPVNSQLVKWGLSRETARHALNPGFADPFPAATTITLDNPAYRWLGVSLMRGKLDWVLLRRLQVHAREERNRDYALSDHRWLVAEVSLE